MHVVSDSGAGSATGEWTWAAVFGLTALITAGEVVYSQTMACVVDEGYHLLAAQLILLGKRPYLDFVFPQTPLNAYWNALWMGILGQSWRPIHLIAALETMAAVYINADFVLRRFPFAGWRLAAALTTVVVFGLNDAVFKFGAVAQPYGICLLLSAASLRSAVAAVERESRWLAALAGACAAGAAASSLLTAPVVPVLLVWTWFYSTPARRLGSCLSLLGGAVVPFLPSVWLLLHGPEQVIFGTIAYQLLYRRLDWPGAIDHDAGVMLSWVDSGQALILIVLSLVALGFVRSRKDWTRLQRAPFYLCGWMALALAFHISQAHPTFAWYYLLMLPFLGVLAPLGCTHWAPNSVMPPGRAWRCCPSRYSASWASRNPCMPNGATFAGAATRSWPRGSTPSARRRRASSPMSRSTSSPAACRRKDRRSRTPTR